MLNGVCKVFVPNEVDLRMVYWIRDCLDRGERGEDAIVNWILQCSTDELESYLTAARFVGIYP